MNNGDTIIINIPPLTEERKLVKIVRNESENSKISIRNIRKDSNQEIKTDIDDEKSNYEIDIKVDNFISKIESVLSKGKEIDCVNYPSLMKSENKEWGLGKNFN